MTKSLPIRDDPHARRAFTMHERTWRENRYVYPVVSRRSKGVSIGINLNPDKVCNFDCIYCSVDRKSPPAARSVDLGLLRKELSAMLKLAASGEIFRLDPFDAIPAPLRRVNDIAFSGDGEPTTFPEFYDCCRMAVEMQQAADLKDLKIVVITNATMFHRPKVRKALALLDRHKGEIWGKLDAGTDEYYHLVDRTTIPFARVLENLRWAARTRPIVIQSLFMRVHGEPPSAAEVLAYATRIREIQAASSGRGEMEGGGGAGGIKLVQVYTVARQTTESYVSALSLGQLNAIAATVMENCPGPAVEVYP